MKKVARRYILDPEHARWLAEEAERRRCSMSQVVRDLIAAEQARRARRRS